MKTKLIATFVMVLALAASSSLAQDPSEPQGFSKARLTSVAPAKSHDSKACLNFEATFSGPLKERPSAILDFVKSDLIDGVLSFMLKVTPLGKKRYALTMETDDPRSCTELKRGGRKVMVTVDGAVGPDGRDVLPDQKTFKTY